MKRFGIWILVCLLLGIPAAAGEQPNAEIILAGETYGDAELEQLLTPGNVFWADPWMAYWYTPDGPNSWSAGNTKAEYFHLYLYKDGEKFGEPVQVNDWLHRLDLTEYITETGMWQFSVQAIGDGITYADSEESYLSEPFSYGKKVPLEIPEDYGWTSEVEIWWVYTRTQGEMEDVVMPSKAVKYLVQLYKDGSAYGEPVEAENSAGCIYLDVSPYINDDGMYQFTITAVGDGFHYVDSVATPMSDTMYITKVQEEEWNTWENLQWQFDADTRTLTVQGEGAIPTKDMQEYPWYSYLKSDILHIVVQEGITEIPIFAFANCMKQQSLSLPASLEKIEYSVFSIRSTLTEITVEEGGRYYSENNVLFERTGEDTVSLLLYPRGLKATSYTVPEEVTTIGRDAFNNSYLEELILTENLLRLETSSLQMNNMTELYIPASVNYISETSIFGCTSLQNVTVDAKNTAYMSVDGVLYDKTMKTIYCFPQESSITDFRVPDSVERISSDLFFATENLKTLYIPASVDSVYWKNIKSNGSGLQSIVVADENPILKSVNGVLYNKDMTKLYAYPAQHPAAEFRIPDTVTTLGIFSMYEILNMESLYMGSGITRIENRLLSDVGELRSVYIPGDFPEYFQTAFGLIRYDDVENMVFYYEEGAEGWSSPSMNINGMEYHTSVWEKDIPAGDITGDGTTDQNDLSLLTQYFSGYPTEIDESAVDLDGNGKLTRKDVMILARYLAGWDGYDQYFS